MSEPVFEVRYRGKLWRVELSSFEGQDRLSIWSHYQDQDGTWKPCGGKRDSPGCIIPAERVGELAATLLDLANRLESGRT